MDDRRFKIGHEAKGIMLEAALGCCIALSMLVPLGFLEQEKEVTMKEISSLRQELSKQRDETLVSGTSTENEQSQKEDSTTEVQEGEAIQPETSGLIILREETIENSNLHQFTMYDPETMLMYIYITGGKEGVLMEMNNPDGTQMLYNPKEGS